MRTEGAPVLCICWEFHPKWRLILLWLIARVKTVKAVNQCGLPSVSARLAQGEIWQLRFDSRVGRETGLRGKTCSRKGVSAAFRRIQSRRKHLLCMRIYPLQSLNSFFQEERNGFI